MNVTSHFSKDNFTSRRSNTASAGVGFDPESLMTGKEIEAGFTYTNSHRSFESQAQYEAIVAGEIPVSVVPEVAPRVFNG